MIKREPVKISRIAIVAGIALLATFILVGVGFLKSGVTKDRKIVVQGKSV